MNKFKFIHDLSIRNKIILIVLFVTILVHSIGFTYITVWNMNRIITAIKTGLVINTKLISSNCIVPLIFGDDQQATLVLSHLENIGFIDKACLFDNNGHVFATYPDTLNPNDFPILNEYPNTTFKDGFFYINEPVMFKKEKYGNLFLKANSSILYRVKKKIIIRLFLLSIVLDVLAIFLALRMQKYISIPIVKLKNHFETLTRTQDFSQRIKKYNNDEVGHLYDEFNNLISQIQSRSLERDSAEKQLRESQDKLNLALQGGEIGIWEWELKTNRVTWDAKVEKMFGLKEGVFNQTYEDYMEYLHPDDVVFAKAKIQDALNDVAPYDNVFRVVWENDETKFIRAKALVSRDEEQKPIKMIGVCFDVTEIKEVERELQIYRENLENLVIERTDKLETKNQELEMFNHLFEDREFRIKELREELDRLKSDK